MKQKTLIRLSVAATVGLLTPLTGYAFGLGQITLHSALNEPFRAEITVNALRDDERGNLDVRLASSAAFERAGLERSFLLTQLNFKVIEEASYTRIIVTSDMPIKEPFLGFLLAATTGQGKLLREYTVLLDPPKELYRAGRTNAPFRSAATSQINTGAGDSQTQPAVWGASSSAISGYRVRSHDTLWSIAEKIRPSADTSIQQMMIALLNENPQAFQQTNVNSLYADSTLSIPATSDITRLSLHEAKSAIEQHNISWQNRAQSNRPVSTSNEATVPESNVVSLERDAAVDTATTNIEVDEVRLMEEGGQQASADAKARLKLVAATENSVLEADPQIKGDPDIQHISEQLTLAQETIEAQSQENIDFKSRMDAMERQLETMRRLVSLKDADMARLQNLLEQDEVQMDLALLVDEANAVLDGNEAATDITEVAMDRDLVEAWQPVSIDNDALADPTDQNNKVVATAGESGLLQETGNETLTYMNSANQADTAIDAGNDDGAELTAAELDDAINEAAKVLDIAQQQMESIYQRVQTFVLAHKIEALLAALLFLLIMWMVIRRGQREISWDDAVGKVDNNKPANTTPEMGVVNDVTPVVNETHASPENQTTSVEELVEQADKLVGYADYVQAGVALEQAHQQAPDDKEIATKLMFVYYKQQKSVDFIALLNSSKIDETYSQWAKVRGWGNQLLPHHPLFSEAFGLPDEGDVDVVQDKPEVTVGENFVSEALTESSGVEESDHIEFNLDDYKADSAKASQADKAYEHDEEDLLQFDIDYLTDEDVAVPATEIETDELRIDLDRDNVLQPASSSPEVLDFKIDDPEIDSFAINEVVEKQPIEPLELDELDLPDFDTEIDTPEKTGNVIDDNLSFDNSIDDEELDFDLSDFDSIDEAETKLDLATAYMEMGDPEGARGILEEVSSQGTDEQKQRAQELLDALA